MSRLATAVAFFLCAITVGLGQTTSATQPAASSHSAETHNTSVVRGVLPVSLTKSVDSKSLKENDEVEGKILVSLSTSKGMLLPAGSKLIGHVTQSTSRAKGDPESSLGMVFDKIEIAKGEELPIKGVIQAIAPSQESGPTTGAAGGLGMGNAGQSSQNGGVGAGTIPGPVATVGPMPGDGPQAGSGPSLTSQSNGVVGIKNLKLTDNSILVSTGKEVKLDKGTRMMVKAE